jgi:hypothetical protein
MITIDNVDTKINKFNQIKPLYFDESWLNYTDRRISPPIEIIRNTSTTGELLKISNITVCIEKFKRSTMNFVIDTRRVTENENWDMYSWKRDSVEKNYQGKIAFFICEGSTPSFTNSLSTFEQKLILESEIINNSNISFLSQFQQANNYFQTTNTFYYEIEDFCNYNANIYLKPNCSILFYAEPLQENQFSISRAGYSIATTYQTINISGV